MAYDITKLAPYQQEVQRLHDKHFSEISETMIKWAFKKAERVGFRSAVGDSRHLEDAWCPICGCVIKANSKKCPHCGASLGETIRPMKNYYISDCRMDEKPHGCRSYKDYYTFEEITTCKGWQIYRIWLVDFTFRKGKALEMSYIGSLFERWFNPTIGKEVLLGKYRGAFPYMRRIPWAISYFGSTEGYVHKTLQLDSYEDWANFRYPRVRLLDWYKEKCVDKVCRQANLKTTTAFRLLISKKKSTITETMLKVGTDSEIRLMVEYTSSFFKYWRTILISRRHNFCYAQYGVEYFDYLHQLEQLHLDLRSPHYVAPDDFRAMHQRMTKRLNDIAERERREWQRRREIEEYKKAVGKESAYKKARGMYFGLVLVGKEYKAEPLKSIKEFLDEGINMDHCVFSGGYYNTEIHPNSLILSVRNKESNEREVTIEISTKSWKILQCYAKHDNIHPKDKQIRKWIRSNMETIKSFSVAPRRRATATA